MDTTETFGAALRRLREAAGLSQAELARRSGIRQPNVARLEAGGREPSWETVQRLADAVGVATDAFRGREKISRKKRGRA